MAFDLARFATAGATRPDAISGLNDRFESGLAQMFAAAPPDVQAALKLYSAYRSPEVQATLYENALKKYGNEQEARRWVAPPGKSQHNHGNAADLRFANDAARQWAHENAGQFGLAFPLDNEDWHIELADARGGDAGGAQQAQMLPPIPIVPTDPTPTNPQAPPREGEQQTAQPSGSALATMFSANPWGSGIAAAQGYMKQEAENEEREKARRQRIAMMFSRA